MLFQTCNDIKQITSKMPERNSSFVCFACLPGWRQVNDGCRGTAEEEALQRKCLSILQRFVSNC